MVNRASISLVPSEMCGDTRGRKISKLLTVVALGSSVQHATLLHARKLMEGLVFNSKQILCPFKRL